MFVFKVRNAFLSNADRVTITWNGKSSVAPSSNPVSLDIWNNTLSAWVSASTDNFTAADTPFTFSVATSGSAFYDNNYFAYVRVYHQNTGAATFKTDYLNMSFGGVSGTGRQVTSRSDTVSDSRPGAGANHTISFVINSAIDAAETLQISWSSGFAFPSGLDCGDADVATGTQFTLSTTSNSCAATANTWGALFNPDALAFRLVAPSTAGTYVATGTQMTITIGINASSQQAGNTRITNPSAPGTYTVTIGGTFGGSGNTLVSINAGQTVQATVAENLSFTVSSVAAVNCTANDGASITKVDSSSTTVAFGFISASTFYQGCQDLIVSTNAQGGYSLAVQESYAMKTASGAYVIPDTSCDSNSCATLGTAGTWTSPSNYGFGHTCYNQDGNHDCDSAYANGTKFRRFANIAAGETALPIMASSTRAIATGRMKYRLSAPQSQATGTYTTVVTYTILGTF
jgi:hypothetical protein